MELSEIYELYLKHKAVTTDSRDCPEGSIFFALRGDNFDGNAYASKALEQGCAYAVVDEEQYAVKGSGNTDNGNERKNHYKGTCVGRARKKI